jgi:hypothetical protein
MFKMNATGRCLREPNLKAHKQVPMQCKRPLSSQFQAVTKSMHGCNLQCLVVSSTDYSLGYYSTETVISLYNTTINSSMLMHHQA